MCISRRTSFCTVLCPSFFLCCSCFFLEAFHLCTFERNCSNVLPTHAPFPWGRSLQLSRQAFNKESLFLRKKSVKQYVVWMMCRSILPDTNILTKLSYLYSALILSGFSSHLYFHSFPDSLLWVVTLRQFRWYECVRWECDCAREQRRQQRAASVACKSVWLFLLGEQRLQSATREESESPSGPQVLCKDTEVQWYYGLLLKKLFNYTIKLGPLVRPAAACNQSSLFLAVQK